MPITRKWRKETSEIVLNTVLVGQLPQRPVIIIVGGDSLVNPSAPSVRAFVCLCVCVLKNIWENTFATIDSAWQQQFLQTHTHAGWLCAGGSELASVNGEVNNSRDTCGKWVRKSRRGPLRTRMVGWRLRALNWWRKSRIAAAQWRKRRRRWRWMLASGGLPAPVLDSGVEFETHSSGRR